MSKVAKVAIIKPNKGEPFEIAYKEYASGKKIIDFSDMRREGIIEIIPIDAKKFESLPIKCFKESKSGVWFGIPLEIDERSGHITWKTLTVTGTLILNLEDEESAKEWHVLKHHERLLGSPLERHKPLLKVYDREIEATGELKRMRDGQLAFKYAMDFQDNKEALADFARYIGFSPESNSPIVLLKLVAERAMKRPDEFLRLYENPSRKAGEIFKRCVSAGLIKYKDGQGYIYNETFPLGSSEQGVLNALMGQRELMASADSESRFILKGSLTEYPAPAKEKFKNSEPAPLRKQQPAAKKAVVPVLEEKNNVNLNFDLSDPDAGDQGNDDNNDDWSDPVDPMDSAKGVLPSITKEVEAKAKQPKGAKGRNKAKKV